MTLSDEVLSPSPLLATLYRKLVDDVVYEVDAAKIVVSDGDIDIGANPSAEEQAEALENGAEQVINIVHSFRLSATSFDKKSYLTYLKVRIARHLDSLTDADGILVAVSIEEVDHSLTRFASPCFDLTGLHEVCQDQARGEQP